MPLIPWRKLQAGLSGQGDAATLQTVIQHIQGNTDSGAISTFDTMVVNHLVVRRTAKLPVGTDKYK